MSKVRALAVKLRAVNGKVRALPANLRAVNESKGVRNRQRVVIENKSVQKSICNQEKTTISFGRGGLDTESKKDRGIIRQIGKSQAHYRQDP